MATDEACRRAGRASVSWALAAVVLLVAPASGGSLPNTPPQAAQHLLALLKAGKTAGASKLFHLPSHYDAEAARAERRGLAGSLNALTEQFGSLTEFRSYLGVYQAMTVSLVPGTVEDAETGALPSEGVRVTYRARFAREGECWVSVDLAPDGSRWMVRALHLGLDADRPDAEERLQTILRHLGEGRAAGDAT